LEDTHRVHAWNFPEYDITKPEELGTHLQEIKPELVINTAAYNRVDDCEEDLQQAFALNAFAVRDLSLLCRKLGASLLHFSSDYVFDGSQKVPYTESDAPNPLNVYGVSKLAGEFFVRNSLEHHFVVRTSGLYGKAGCWGKGTNFVDAMVHMARSGKPIRVVNDQWITPTYTRELAQKLKDLVESGRFGLYHLTNSGQCTWFDFAKEIFRQLGLNPSLSAVSSSAYRAQAERPSYSVLANRNAEELGLTDFEPWQEALREYLHEKGYLV